MKHVATGALAGIALFLLAVPLQGQMRPLELGVDGGVVYTDPAGEGRDNRVWDLALPVQNLRLGVFLTDRISVEPSISLARLDLRDDEDLTQVGAAGNLLYHLDTPGIRPRFFGQVGGGMEYVRVSDGGFRESDTQWLAGAGLGMRLPVADRIALRTSAVYWRAFESDLAPDANQVRGQLGISFFTR